MWAVVVAAVRGVVDAAVRLVLHGDGLRRPRRRGAVDRVANGSPAAGGPPAHWVALVRERAPQLLQPAEMPGGAAGSGQRPAPGRPPAVSRLAGTAPRPGPPERAVLADGAPPVRRHPGDRDRAGRLPRLVPAQPVRLRPAPDPPSTAGELATGRSAWRRPQGPPDAPRTLLQALRRGDAGPADEPTPPPERPKARPLARPQRPDVTGWRRPRDGEGGTAPSPAGTGLRWSGTVRPGGDHLPRSSADRGEPEGPISPPRPPRQRRPPRRAAPPVPARPFGSPVVPLALAVDVPVTAPGAAGEGVAVPVAAPGHRSGVGEPSGAQARWLPLLGASAEVHPAPGPASLRRWAREQEEC